MGIDTVLKSFASAGSPFAALMLLTNTSIFLRLPPLTPNVHQGRGIPSVGITSRKERASDFL